MDKKKKFKETANLRLHNAITCIKRLEALANSRYYDYTDAEANQIVKFLENAVKKVKTKFNDRDVVKKSKNNEIPDYFS